MPTSVLPLTVELVPATSWYRNVRANVSERSWAALQRLTFTTSGYRCEICTGVGPRHPVECHEIWRFDDRLRLQQLVRLIALCPSCHCVKHLGHTLAAGKRDAVETAFAWFCHVNRTPPHAAIAHLQSVFAEHEERSRVTYQLDVRLLRRYGIDLDAHGVEVGHRPTGLEY